MSVALWAPCPSPSSGWGWSADGPFEVRTGTGQRVNLVTTPPALLQDFIQCGVDESWRLAWAAKMGASGCAVTEHWKGIARSKKSSPLEKRAAFLQ